MPVNNNASQDIFVQKSIVKTKQDKEYNQKKTKILKKPSNFFSDYKMLSEIEVVLPSNINVNVTKKLINSLELSIYEKEISNISLNIHRYESNIELKKIVDQTIKPGKIYIGTLTGEATQIIKNFCAQGIIFFSFSSDRKLANECVYLINFFPEDDLKTLFNYFPNDSKIALLYPENKYGYIVNSIIDDIALKSNSLIINRASYKEDLTNARDAIKELSKYELRRYELSRQKKILKNKKDKISLKALKKIEKFETLGKVDFTHLILPDYSIRLLEIAPLLPFYDVDPNVVQFVGTGVWDDQIFFNEPSLQGAIFSGIEKNKRTLFFNNYKKIYNEKPMRTATIPYDLLGIITYIIGKKQTNKEVYDLLDSGQVKFDGIDGKFSFFNNVITRDLNILKISKGKALKLN